ncbi:hypothetical protein ACFQMH_03340 [Streptomyces viridiviolaceus]|uniref:Transposase n=1 Tax=Streptomyces viridiviolaceus TaxID=68282 RepID=A0ABW2DSF1_9ACTN|nr:hypothetical protein [Streptomyces viridiviolaceus]
MVDELQPRSVIGLVTVHRVHWLLSNWNRPSPRKIAAPARLLADLIPPSPGAVTS